MIIILPFSNICPHNISRRSQRSSLRNMFSFAITAPLRSLREKRLPRIRQRDQFIDIGNDDLSSLCFNNTGFFKLA